jgi:hypothetical protein
MGYSAVVFRQGSDDYPVDAVEEVRLGNAAMIGYVLHWAQQNLPSDAVLTRTVENMGSGAAVPQGDLPQLRDEILQANESTDPDVQALAASLSKLVEVAVAEGSTISFV